MRRGVTELSRSVIDSLRGKRDQLWMRLILKTW